VRNRAIPPSLPSVTAAGFFAGAFSLCDIGRHEAKKS
jgi:hypothetical protein